jgi:hypothetical protein
MALKTTRELWNSRTLEFKSWPKVKETLHFKENEHNV